MAHTPTAWFACAREAYDEVLKSMARHGIHTDPALEFVPAEAPTPYYEPATVTIGIGMPDPATVKGRLYWLYAARVLGYDGVDEVVTRQAEQLPFMVAHEVAHHLRQHYGAPIANDFVEEQVANAIALAFVHEHPTYREQLGAMREAASKATVTLSLLTPEATPFVGGFRLSRSDALVELGKLTVDELRDLDLVAEGAGVGVEELLVEAGVVSQADASAADAAREGAQAYFNAGYMANLLEYGYFHMAWIAAYLERDDPQPLAEAVEDYLLTPDWERTRERETHLLVRQLLREAPDDTAPVLAEALTACEAGHLAVDLVDVLPRAAPATQAAILLALARHSVALPLVTEAAAALVRAPQPDVRAAAAVVLWRSPAGRGPSRETISSLIRSGDVEARSAGLRAAAELGDDILRDDLFDCLGAAEADARSLALQALAVLPPDPGIGLRVACLAGDETPTVRVAVAGCLGRHRSADGLQVLLTVLDDPVESVRRQAIAAVTEYGTGALPNLRAVHGSWRVRTEAALLRHLLGEERGALDDVMAELVSAARSLARPLPAELGAGAHGSVLEDAISEQRRKVCFLALRVVAATREGQAMDQVLESLRWGDSSARPGLLRMARRALPADLWPLLDGQPPAGSGAAPPLPLTRSALEVLAANFEPFLRDLILEWLNATNKEAPMLTDIEKLIFLRTIPLFRDVELADLRRLAETCEVYRYQAGEHVFRQGDNGDRFFLVSAGRVAVEQAGADGTPVRLGELGPGSSFGETAFFSDVPRTAGVFAVVDSTLLGLRRGPVLQTGARHPSILLGMIRAMSERMADPTAGRRL